jgi:hypothetical protein
MLGLAVMTALMAMVSVGASAAMAELDTALCKVEELPCAKANLVKHVHETTLEGKKAKLVSSVGTVECDVLLLGDVLTAGLLALAPEPLLISGNFTYSNCFLGGGKCTVKEENGPTHVDVLKLAWEEAKVTGEGLVHVECSGLNCSYNGKELIGHALGPYASNQSEKNGSVSLESQETNKESGLFCPSTSKLTITTTPLPEPVYISS